MGTFPRGTRIISHFFSFLPLIFQKYICYAQCVMCICTLFTNAPLAFTVVCGSDVHEMQFRSGSRAPCDARVIRELESKRSDAAMNFIFIALRMQFPMLLRSPSQQVDFFSSSALCSFYDYAHHGPRAIKMKTEYICIYRKRDMQQLKLKV